MAEKIIAEATTEVRDSQIESNSNDESVTEDVPVADETEAGSPEPTGSKAKDKTEPLAGEEGKVVAAKSVYTPTELEEMLQSGSDVDTSRLSDEGKLLMKSFQRGMDKKFQQLAEMRKSIEAQKPPDPREQLFNRYMEDPAGVVGEINSEIENLEGVDPSESKFTESRRTIARLQALKDDFSVKRQGVIEHGRQTSDIVATTRAEIVKSIPDFETKSPKLTDFAVSLGLSITEIQALTDPTVVGPMALKLTKAINMMYDKINAPKTAEGKVKKDAPAPLQRGAVGTILDKKDEGDDPTKMDMPRYLLWRKKHSVD